MGEVIIDQNSPVSHVLLVIEPYLAKMENCDVKDAMPVCFQTRAS